MSRYIIAIPKDPRFDKYKYIAESVAGPRFTDCVFEAIWYGSRVAAEIAKDNLSREYHAIVLSLENTIAQIDRENDYKPFYILRDTSDNRMVRKIATPMSIPLFTDGLKNTLKFETVDEAMDAIDNINRHTNNTYEFIVEMHHFDEFYKERYEHSEEPQFFIHGGRGGGKTWLDENPNIAIPNTVTMHYTGHSSINSIISAKEMYNMFGSTYHLPEIKKVIFSNSVTIVLWKDGTKTIVRCQDGETFDPEKGLGMAFMKKAFGNKGNYFDKVRNLLNNATYQNEEDQADQQDRKGCKDDVPFAKKTKNGTYKCPHCSRFVPSKRIEGKKGPFTCDKCGKKFNINWEGELDYEF